MSGKRLSLKGLQKFLGLICIFMVRTGCGRALCKAAPPCVSCGYEYHRDWDNCSKIYLCEQGSYTEIRCPEGHAFSGTKLRCIDTVEINQQPECNSVRRLPLAAFRAREDISPGGESCGVSNRLSISAKIVNGGESSPAAWPWQVSVQDKTGHMCGGTLVDHRWVVTAAHCVQGDVIPPNKIVLGMYKMGTTSTWQKSRSIENVFPHPKYFNGDNFPNDIAMVKLQDSVEYSRFIRPACLPSEDLVFNQGDGCWITGWGEAQDSVDPAVLNELKVKIRTMDDCRNAWKGLVTSNQICVNNGIKGACYGDSGGPLVCRRKEHWTLAGVASWGYKKCSQQGFPGVFTRVTKYIRWITETMRLNS